METKRRHGNNQVSHGAQDDLRPGRRYSNATTTRAVTQIRNATAQVINACLRVIGRRIINRITAGMPVKNNDTTTRPTSRPSSSEN